MAGQQLLNAIALSSIYALFAVGYTLIFGVLRVLNLAHAAIYASGAMSALFVVRSGGGFALAIACGTVVAAVLGLILDVAVFRPLRQRGGAGQMSERLMPLVGSIAFGVILSSVLVMTMGVDFRRFPESAMPTQAFEFGGVRVGVLHLTVIGISFVLMLLLHWLVYRSKVGRAIRGVAESPQNARLVGVRVDRIFALTMLLASGLAGIAGTLIGVYSNVVYPYMGATIELKGLAMVVLGGMGSIYGAVIAAFIVGGSETIAAGYLDPGWQPTITFGAVLVVLMLRPQGLFGNPSEIRA